MDTFLRKALLVGLGVAALGKEKMEDLLEDLSKMAERGVERGNEEDILSRIVSKGQEAREDFETRIVQELGGIISKTDFATKKDISRLEAKIDRLAKIIQEQQK